MRKFWKIFGITLGSLLGLVVVVAGVLVYVVFTPNRLTPIVDKVAGEYIDADYHIGSVDLTFFSTFPEFGLRADGILIVNPTEGAQSDTLLEAKKVVARIDVMKLLKEGDVNIHELSLQDLSLNAYIGADGQTNFDILTLPEDTTEEDTTSGSFIRSISMEDLKVTLDANTITLVDEKDSIRASLIEPVITLSAKTGNDSSTVKGRLEAHLPELSANIGGEDYASDAAIHIEMPFDLEYEMPELMDFTTLKVQMSDAKLQVNEFSIGLDGRASVVPEIDVNMDLNTNKWHISDLLALIPQSIFTMPDGIHADGDVRLKAHVEGVYNDSTMPLIDANILLTDATGSIDELPYVLEDVKGEVDAHLDLNDEKQSKALIKSLSANTKSSSFTATGEVDDLLNKILLDIRLGLDVYLPDAAYFLPDNMTADGQAKGTLKARISLDDLSNVQLSKGKIHADISFDDLNATMDSMRIRSKKADLVFNIPNTRNEGDKARLKKISFLDGTLAMSELTVKEEGSLDVALGKADLDLQVNDIINNSDIIYANVGLKTSKLDATVQMDSSTAVVNMKEPDLKAYVEYNTVSDEAIPVVDAQFAMQQLDAVYDDIDAHLSNPSGTAALQGGTMAKAQVAAKVKADDLDAKVGTSVVAETGKLNIAASGQHTSNTENILLEWCPKLDFDLQKAKAQLEGFEPEVIIPEIKLTYSNQEFRIDTSRIELGHSDFSLTGYIKGIGGWLDKTEYMKGELNFTSDNTDINELLTYVSGMGDEEEDDEEESETASAATEETETESEPFIVPKRMDICLHTKMKNASAFGQKLNNLGGDIYIRDGVLVVKEVGFICNAAKLQLTAMYKTPRRNHIFVGVDYHMTEVDIKDLVEMIPPIEMYVPMMSAFSGKANFHLAAETYCDAQYNIKPSTTRAACAIDGKDLDIDDNDTFSKIAKILSFNRTSEFKIDSISTEIDMYKNDIQIYPLLVTWRNWKAAIGGEHYVDNTKDLSNIEMSANYHVSLLSPLYIGVDVTGPLSDLSIKPAKCKYAKEFRPIRTTQTETESANIRKMIKAALEKALK